MSSEETEPITGRYPELARMVRELTGAMSARQVERKTGVNFSTVTTMRKGDRASMETILKFARGFGVAPNPLLRASGYPEIKGGDDSEEIEYVTDPEYIPIPEGYDDLPLVARQAASRAAQEAFRGIAEMFREARRDSPGTIGFGADRYEDGGRRRQDGENTEDAGAGDEGGAG